MANDFNLGRHEALIEQLVRGQNQIFARLGDVENILAERRGERRVATAIWASASGAVGAFVVFITKAWLSAHHVGP
jgi:hypothetical protein